MARKSTERADRRPEPGHDDDPESGAGAGSPQAREPEAGGDPESELERVARQRDEYLEHWRRAQADYQNLRRRTFGEIEGAVRRETQPLLEDLLLVMDHLDLALASPCTGEESRNLARGIELIRDQLVRALERQEVRPVPEGGQLDPSVHDAVSRVVDPELEPGTIVQTVRRGYTWKDAVLRPAHVVVATAPDAGGETPT